MASAKRANVPPTHPTVWVGLALAVVGLLLAVYAYTGSRVYDIVFVVVAIAGGLLALVGILTAAWGRSLMAARATRARRAAFSADAMAASPRPEPAEPAAEEPPTVAAPASKSRFRFLSRSGKEATASERSELARVFAFGRRGPSAPEPAPPEPTSPEPTPAPAETAAAVMVRVTLRCPECSSTFQAEGIRPFEAACPSCAFRANV